MKPKTRAWPLALLLFLTACSRMTLEEYYVQLGNSERALTGQRLEAQATAEQQFASAASVEEATAALEDLLAELAALGNTSLSNLETLNPPEEAQEAHERYLSATKNAVEELESVLRELRVGDPADIERVFSPAGMKPNAALLGMVDACSALQDIGDENKIDMDLVTMRRPARHP